MATLECLSRKKQDKPEDISSLLTHWFDRLLPPAPTEHRLSEWVESGYALLSPSPKTTTATSTTSSFFPSILGSSN
ncbi:MAG: hypothetical protein JSR33_12845 [Proteobacteria bacterium]|nr:hypothetical protein [Pseudomonadota bacterium]